jgi:hypothetical protein
VAAQAGLGRFFARKFRAGLAYAFYEKTANAKLIEEALLHYRSARKAWEQLVEVTRDVYVSDISFGVFSSMRGHWKDRVADIDEDIAAMEQELSKAGNQPLSSQSAVAAAKAAFGKRTASSPNCLHTPQETVRRGDEINLKVTVQDAANDINMKLHYRRANQAERYNVMEMNREGSEFTAEIPGSYTDSPYPIIYFFEGVKDSANAWYSPSLAEDLSNQPYYVVRLA